MCHSLPHTPAALLHLHLLPCPLRLFLRTRHYRLQQVHLTLRSQPLRVVLFGSIRTRGLRLHRR